MPKRYTKVLNKVGRMKTASPKSSAIIPRIASIHQELREDIVPVAMFLSYLSVKTDNQQQVTRDECNDNALRWKGEASRHLARDRCSHYSITKKVCSRFQNSWY